MFFRRCKCCFLIISVLDTPHPSPKRGTHSPGCLVRELSISSQTLMSDVETDVHQGKVIDFKSLIIKITAGRSWLYNSAPGNTGKGQTGSSRVTAIKTFFPHLEVNISELESLGATGLNNSNIQCAISGPSQCSLRRAQKQLTDISWYPEHRITLAD